MKAFRFKLESLLTFRRIQKEKAFEIYAESLNQKRDLENLKNRCAQEKEGIQNEIEKSRRGTFFPHTQSRLELILLYKAQELDQLNLELAEMTQKVSMYFLEFLKAKMNEDILLKLKEKHQKEYQYHFMKQEEKEVDDLVNCSLLKGRGLQKT